MPRAAGRDDGSALAEFVLVGVMLTLLFLVVLQLGIAYHLRNTLAACAADGARYGAAADVRSTAAAAARARQRVAESVGGAVSGLSAGAAVRAVDPADPAGPQVMVVRLHASLPAVLGLVRVIDVSVQGRSLLEPALAERAR